MKAVLVHRLRYGVNKLVFVTRSVDDMLRVVVDVDPIIVHISIEKRYWVTGKGPIAVSHEYLSMHGFAVAFPFNKLFDYICRNHGICVLESREKEAILDMGRGKEA